MLRRLVLTALSAAAAASIVFVAAPLLAADASQSDAQQPAAPRLARNVMLETAVDLEGGAHHVVIAELSLEPGATTPLHVHPGPSVGFVNEGRLAITVPDTGRVTTFAAGSALDHPWDRPHIMANNSDQMAKALSFEITPVQGDQRGFDAPES